jgi:hypothetical protein
MSNLNESYQLRLDRLCRIRNGFNAGRITEYEFRKLMAQEGITDKRDLDAEVSTFRPIGEAAGRVVDGLKK